MEEAFLQRMREMPDDGAARMIFADWLEEQGDPRAELLRLTQTLIRATDFPGRPACEARLRELLASGVRPVGPFWTNSLGMRFAWIPGGVFLMGSPPDEPDRQDDEARRPVTLTRGFYMGVHPVTQAQWRAVTGDEPGCFRGDDRPVEGVSWENCRDFCLKLARKDGLRVESHGPYRLPTEAEWEYACRAGVSAAFHFGPVLSLTQAHYHASHAPAGPGGRRRQETAPVGAFSANAWGLHDMHGNVFEWCSDWYAPHPPGPATDPGGPAHGSVRVLRGGSWHSLVGRCRSACRGWGAPGYQGSDVGCRVCFQLVQDFTL